MNHRPIIVAIDDAAQNLAVIDALLSDAYRVKVAPHGKRGLQLAQATPKPDLILLDILMPEMDGFEVCRRLKANPHTQDIPVIFLTAKTRLDDEEEGLSLGAVDYVTKPISPAILKARVKTHLTLKRATDQLADRNQHLEQEVARRTEEVRWQAHLAQKHLEELQLSHQVTLVALASLAEARDNETGRHLLRTQRYIRCLAEHVRHKPRFASELTPERIDLIVRAAPLHDIGKVGIPDRILLKSSQLTAEEFEVMKTHVVIGYTAIDSAQKRVGASLAILEVAKEITLGHHEQWQGGGYPGGLKGEAIPLSARLMAVADVYDALISRRAYKTAIPHEEAMAIMEAGRGRHFDPELIDGFIEIQDQIKAISREFPDTDVGYIGSALADAAGA